MEPKPKKSKGCFFCLPQVLISLVVVSVLFYVFFLRGAIEESKQSRATQNARALGLMLWAYANDNNGKYPEGKNSTEIFQKLLDSGYLTNSDEGAGNGKVDFGMLYYPMPGKVKADPDTKILKPENVCWDVTCCVDSQSPDRLPTIFLTGYKVSYQAGSSAVPLPHPHRTWLDWWHGKEYPTTFIVVHFMSNSSVLLKASSDGIIHNFIPADFDPKGKTYHQLTPDGELP